MTKPKQISQSEKLYEQLKELADKANGVRLSFELFNNDITEDDNKIFDEFYDCFYLLQEQSIKDNFFWKYCPFKVYKSTFSNRLKDFSKKAFSDAVLLDFACSEISKICELDEFHKTYMFESFLSYKNYYHRSISNSIETNRMSPAFTPYFVQFYLKPELEVSQRKKIDYLIDLVSNEGKTEIIPSEIEPIIDYSDNSLAEKITFLYELGILDFLRKKQPFNTSTNKLASVISSFTGEKQTSIQPALNTIYGKRIVQKNNPLTPNNLQIVRSKLIQLGYQVDKEK